MEALAGFEMTFRFKKRRLEVLEMTHKYVGILLGASVYQGIKRGKTDYENLQFYEEIGKELNIIPCFFRLKDIAPGVNKVKAYVKHNNNKYILTVIPKPYIIHNRIFTNTIQAKQKIKQLQNEGITLFNENNRYPKLSIYEILIKNKELTPYIPETVQAKKTNLIYMMSKYDELIVKPNSGSFGIGIAKLTSMNDQKWEFSYYGKESLIKERFSNSWPVTLQSLISDPNMIIQQRIPLAMSKGSAFDTRVSIQKNGAGEWQVSGIVGKVARKDSFLTNVAQGGVCYPLKELMKDLPHLDHQQVHKEIEQLAIKVVQQLESEIPNLADLGLDIGITNDGIPMFIECNGRDLRYSFRDAKMLEEWQTTYSTPIRYAHYLYTKINRNYG